MARAVHGSSCGREAAPLRYHFSTLRLLGAPLPIGNPAAAPKNIVILRLPKDLQSLEGSGAEPSSGQSVPTRGGQIHRPPTGYWRVRRAQDSQESGLDVLEEILRVAPQAAVIMVTAYASVETAVEAMRRGAFDYLPKPCTPEQVRQVLARIEKTRKLERRVAELESRPGLEGPEIELTSQSPVMQKAIEVAFKAADSEATVLLLGESGTGKSVLARAMHHRSPRRAGAFVTVSCPSLSRELLESELFGHVKGAFTGATTDTMGKVAAADGGTLFLDEIGELPLDIQAKLLRLLQEREYERVGETKPRRANVRVISATNRDLSQAVAGGKFREDLFYRLNVISLRVPPLRDRVNDVETLALTHLRFIAGHSGKSVRAFSPAALEAMRQYTWPGNLRELRNVIERAVILSNGEAIEADDLSDSDSTGFPRCGWEENSPSKQSRSSISAA